MKKLWKVLGITALAAAVVPYRIRKDKEEEKTCVDALLWQATHRTGEGEDKGQVDITFGFKSPLQELREERGLFTDDPDEAVLSAGLADTTIGEAAADLAEATAEKADAVAEKVEDAVEEAAEKVADTVEEAVEKLEQPAEPVVTEEDFDPEL